MTEIRTLTIGLTDRMVEQTRAFLTDHGHKLSTAQILDAIEDALAGHLDDLDDDWLRLLNHDSSIGGRLLRY
ncbi:MAG TPA: hypothetical protein VMX14_13245 [Anaerolineae bacterium]|nr:hypothetical protein [Anaerolineae bacterium]